MRCSPRPHPDGCTHPEAQTRGLSARRLLAEGGEIILTPLLVLYGESRMNYTGAHVHAFTARAERPNTYRVEGGVLGGVEGLRAGGRRADLRHADAPRRA
jgi:hypothetical protein